MSKEFLSHLYWSCVSEDSPYVDGCDLAGMYERIEETRPEADQIPDILEPLEVDEEAKGSLLRQHYVQCRAWERQGFINGFRLGMKLAGELAGEEVTA